VADEDDRDALSLQRLQDAEELGRLLGVSTAVGSSRIRMPGVPVEAFRISTRCCWPTPMSSIRASGSIWKPNRPRHLAHAHTRGVVVEEALVARLDPEHDVLGDRHHRDEHEVLVHHADPALDRVLRRAERDALAVEDDLTLVGLREPVEDVHQRRLAGAVLAEQRVNLAAAKVEVDVVVGDGAGKDLRDSPAVREPALRPQPSGAILRGWAEPTPANR
jgi:hypothetical protein